MTRAEDVVSLFWNVGWIEYMFSPFEEVTVFVLGMVGEIDGFEMNETGGGDMRGKERRGRGLGSWYW